jgi:hypothetical protein
VIFSRRTILYWIGALCALGAVVLCGGALLGLLGTWAVALGCLLAALPSLGMHALRRAGDRRHTG